FFPEAPARFGELLFRMFADRAFACVFRGGFSGLEFNHIFIRARLIRAAKIASQYAWTAERSQVSHIIAGISRNCCPTADRIPGPLLSRINLITKWLRLRLSPLRRSRFLRVQARVPCR